MVKKNTLTEVHQLALLQVWPKNETEAYHKSTTATDQGWVLNPRPVPYPLATAASS